MPDPSDDVGLRKYRAEQARLIVTGLRTLATRSEGPRTPTPEKAAAEAWPYVEGWMSAVQTVAPEVLEDVGNAIESSLCDPATKPTQQMLLVRMGEHDPLFVSQRGLTCTIARYTQGAEPDHVLWTALDAWDAADLPVTPELEQLASLKGDERTQSNVARIRGELNEPTPEPMSPEEEARLEALMPPPQEAAPSAQGPAPHPLNPLPGSAVPTEQL